MTQSKEVYEELFPASPDSRFVTRSVSEPELFAVVLGLHDRSQKMRLSLAPHLQ